MINRSIVATSLTALALACVAPAIEAQTPTANQADVTDGWGASGIQTQWIDRSVKPGDDFNAHVNGKWMATATIPADRTSYGSFLALADLSEARMHTLMDEAAQSNPAPGTPAARASAAYKAFMDTDAIEHAGLTPIQPLLQKINAARSVDDLVTLFAEPGLPAPLDFDVDADPKHSDTNILQIGQASLGLPDRDFYLVNTPRNRELQAGYKTYLTRIFTEVGYPDPAKAARDVFALETRMAGANWDRALGRNRDLRYNLLTLDQFAALAPEVPLKAFIAGIGAGQPAALVVEQLPPTRAELAAARYTPKMAAKLGGGVPALAHLIASQPISAWKAWLTAGLVGSNAAVLPHRIDEARFEFYGKIFSGQPEQRPRWKRAIAATEAQSGELVGQLYAARFFPAENKAAMSQLVANLRAALGANLTDLKWMGPKTRIQAEAKLAAFTPKIGYPDRFKTYDGLELRPDAAFGNAIAATRWAMADKMSRLGKPVDRSEWHMLPETVNAYYNSTFNEIVFPGAILQPPFFNLKADDAVNYGAIGAVIGHEMGHGFDDQGAKSDGAGNLRDWWTPADKAAFTRLTDRLVVQYNAFCPFDKGKTCVNGRLTLGENIGDLGGLSVAYRAYHMSLNGKPAPVIDGLTSDQRFFMGYAQVWRQVMREETERQRLVTDPHSPPRYRINGVVRNFDEWYKAFGVKPGDKLYLPPAQRLRIW
ncbi:MAG: M13 family metallopeptidase [Novosphingobium sp.]